MDAVKRVDCTLKLFGTHGVLPILFSTFSKKNTSYVKLEGTNLVFHHIHKRSKPGAIDYMVPLQTCTVEKNPKEFGKKYSILVSMVNALKF